MKVLWIVNIVFPDIADELKLKRGLSGGWLLDLANRVSQTYGIELAIASVYCGKTFVEQKIKNIEYFLLPGGGKKKMFYSKSHAIYWKKIRDKFEPDIVHIHGTEFSHGLVYMDTFPDEKYLLTIQGILKPIAREMTTGINIWQKLRYRTLKENLRLNGMFELKWLFEKNSRYENDIIKRVKYATGRTFWDQCIIKSINPQIKYFKCFNNLRQEFYEAQPWDIDKIERFTIYGSTATQAPLKGGHIVLRAMEIVKRYYPDVKIRFLMPGAKDGKMIPQSGYQKFIKKLVAHLDIENNVEFIPSQIADGVIKHMISSHCTVIPSAMENASATLREAMHIGLPAIASYRGGMTDLIHDGENGFYYDFYEHEFLAGRIMQIFESDSLAKELSKNAIEISAGRHERFKNTNALIEIYNMIMKEG